MHRLLALMGILSCFATSAFAHDHLDISGFARIVGGYFDQDDTTYQGYDNNFSFGEDSLIALRADYSFNEKFSAVGQIIEHSDERRDSGIQWLYLGYEPTKYLQFKLGRQRIPWAQFSDVIDVGFAYPWITPPNALYSAGFLTEFDGGLVRYSFNRKELYGHFEAFYGSFEGDFIANGVSAKSNVENYKGVLAEISFGKFKLRTSFQNGRIIIQQNELDAFANTLDLLGFAASADSLRINNSTDLRQIGFSYDDLDYFVRGEYLEFNANSFLFSKVDTYYLSIGLNRHPWMYHFTLGSGKTDTIEPPNEIPLGVSPELDALALTYEESAALRLDDEGYEYILGVRYDYSANLAFKADITWVEGQTGTRGYLGGTNSSTGKPSGTLFQIALEWVF